jgi:trigger factor
MNFRIEEYRGKRGSAEIEVKEVKRPRMPELDDDFARKVGEADTSALLERVRHTLEAEKKQNAESELRRQVIDRLIAATDFELPEKLLARAAERDELRRHHQLQRMGMSAEALGGEAVEEMRNVSRQQAEREMRGYLIIEKIARARGIEPDEQELHSHFAMLAARRGVNTDALMRHAEEHGELEAVRSELRERKVMELILEKAAITRAEPRPAKDAGKQPAAKRRKSTRTKAVAARGKKASAAKAAAKDQPAKKKTSGRARKVSTRSKAAKKTAAAGEKSAGKSAGKGGRKSPNKK